MATRIIYEGDEAAAKSYLPQAQNLLHKVREFVAASSAGVYSSNLVLNDSAYAYVFKAGETEVIHIFAQPRTEPKPPPYEFEEIPLFLSGVVRNGYIATELVAPPPGQTAPRKIKKLQYFKPNRITQLRNRFPSGAYGEYQRLAVAPHEEAFYGMPAPAPEPLTASQYTVLRPSNYAGRMSKLVQVVLGYGRLPARQIVEEYPADRVTVLREGIQLVYDCRFMRTHGLAKGDDGLDWLIEISATNGVLAMRLPIYKRSQRYKTSDQADLAAAANEFNGLPTGQGFPVGSRLTSAINSGAVLRLMTAEDLAPFYSLSSYSTMCGWAFNSTGTEAHNTAWHFGPDGMKEGFHYTVKISIGPLLPRKFPTDPVVLASARLILASKGKLYHDSINPPIVNGFPRSDLMMPVAQFKYHEPLYNGLVSFDLMPALSGDGAPIYPVSIVCDTTMHVYYSEDDQLKLVRFFHDRGGDITTGESSNFEQVMLIGRWEAYIRSGNRRIPPMYYTSDVDDREESLSNSTFITLVSALAGISQYFPVDPALIAAGPRVWYDSAAKEEGATYGESYINAYPAKGEWVMVYPAGRYIRTNHYKQEWMTRKYEFERVTNSVVIPEGLRAGYVYARLRTSGVRREDGSVSFKAVTMMYRGDVIMRDSDRSIEVLTTGSSFAPAEPGTQAEKEAIDEPGWCSVGEHPVFIDFKLEGYETINVVPAQKSMLVRLYTAYESGGIDLFMPTTQELITKEWRKWARFSPNSEIDPENYMDDATGDTTQEMAVFHSSTLGEPHMVYELKIDSKPEDRKGIGSLVQDVATTGKRDLYNFIGVP